MRNERKTETPAVRDFTDGLTAATAPAADNRGKARRTGAKVDTHTREGFSIPEREIEKKLIRPVRELGGLCLKFETPGYTGVPDRIILLPGGRVLFVETKAPGKKERPRQVLVQSILRRLGFDVYGTVDSLAKVQTVIDACTMLTRQARAEEEQALQKAEERWNGRERV